MTDLLPALFEGKQVRNLQWGGTAGWIPVIDLTQVWGLDRTTLFKHISRNKEDFSDCSQLVDILSTGGLNETVLCVNEVGMYQLLTRVSIARIKSPAAKEAVKKFRRDLPRFVQQFRQGDLVQPSQQQPSIEAELQQATKIAGLTGTDPRALQAVALRKCGLPEYADALQKQLPAVVHGEAGTWLNPTQIGARCGHTAREVNNFLEWHRFQYRGPDGLWRLTDKGELHGEEYSFETVSKHIEIRIRWKESILFASGLIRDQSETLASAGAP